MDIKNTQPDYSRKASIESILDVGKKINQICKKKKYNRTVPERFRDIDNNLNKLKEGSI